MSRTVHLLGRPRIDGAPSGYHVRSRKSWALLAYLILTERPRSRSHLATLLFDEAEDPLGALRWGLSELRRALGDGVVVEGDPVVLRLGPDTVVDVDVVTRGAWADAVRLPTLGSTLLEGLTVHGDSAFDSWLLSEQRRLAAASEEILHEAALASLARGSYDVAIGYAVRLVAMTPLDENHHALLIRLYRLAGEDDAAQRQLITCAEMLRTQLGTLPGPAVRAAVRETRATATESTGAASIEAVLEGGRAAVAAGAMETGADAFRTAVRLADVGGDAELRVSSRLVLAEALIHSLRGLDEEGMATLQRADDIALARADRGAVAEARAEHGYVDMLRARYDRAEVWLTQALQFAEGTPLVAAKATAYLGVVRSDQAQYGAARELLERAAVLARTSGDLRRAAFSLAMLGRLHLLCGDLGPAAAHLQASLELCEREHLLSYTPWPQALLGEVELVRGDLTAASRLLEQAFARACQLRDPCWEGMAARGLALLADARGETARAFDVLADADRRSTRLADSYVWLDAYILDARCTLGRRHDHPHTDRWTGALERLAARTGMREMTVRAAIHRASLDATGTPGRAALLAADIDNPRLMQLVGTPPQAVVPSPRRAPVEEQPGAASPPAPRD
jgi:DNA-binding SARP family transcriptional activator